MHRDTDNSDTVHSELSTEGIPSKELDLSNSNLVHSELEELIHQQSIELRLGSYQPPEPFVMYSLDAVFNDEGKNVEHNNLTAYGTFRLPAPTRVWDGCPLHGRRPLAYKQRGELYCRECNRGYSEAWRRRQGQQRRKVCDHSPSLRYLDNKGHLRCRQCRRDSDKAARARFVEKFGMARNTYKRRLRLGLPVPPGGPGPSEG